MYTFDVTPIGKPRMTQSDRWKNRKCVTQYWHFKDKIKLEASKQKYKIGDVIDVVFYLPMSKSWSEKKKREMIGKPHQLKPDTDNMIKAFCDALTDDDSKIFDKRGRKFWSDRGYIMVVRNEFYTPGDLVHPTVEEMFPAKSEIIGNPVI